MPHWQIEPHDDSQYDSCILPGDTEADHDEAFTYAVARLEEIFDQMEPGDTRTLTVTFSKKAMRYPDPEEEDRTMIPFDQWPILACIDATAHVRTMKSDPDGENGVLRVTLDDGRVYSIHFNPVDFATTPIMQMKIALAEVVRSVHALEAVEETLHSQKVILTNRCHAIQAEIRAMEPNP